MAEDLKALMSELAELKAKVASLERATPLANASVGGGRLRFYDGGELLIEGGNLRVTGAGYVSGTLNVSGVMNVSGTTNLDGPVVIDGDADINGSLDINGPTKITGATNITGNVTTAGTFSNSGTFTNTGPTNLNGATKVNGPWELIGTGQIKGNLTQTGNYTVASPGKITAGNIVIDPVANGGSIKLGGSGIYLGSALTVLGSTGLRLMSGLTEIYVSSSGVQFLNLPTILRANANNAVVNSAYFDGNVLKRVV